MKIKSLFLACFIDSDTVNFIAGQKHLSGDALSLTLYILTKVYGIDRVVGRNAAGEGHFVSQPTSVVNVLLLLSSRNLSHRSSFRTSNSGHPGFSVVTVNYLCTGY